MDRNTVIGFVLIALIIIAYTYFNMPSKAQLEKEKHMQDSIALIQKNQSHEGGTDSLHHPLPTDTSKATTVAPDVRAMEKIFPDSSNKNEEQYTIENELLKITLSNRGGKVASVELKKYKTYDQKPLVLFTPENTKFNYTFFAGNNQIETNDLLFKPESSSFSVTGN